MGLQIGFVALLLLVIVLAGSTFRILREYERGVVFQLGRFWQAKVIHAEGELQASEKLMQAAEMLGRQPGAMQLRYMQTLTSIAGDKSSTIVFPLPIELLKGMADLSGKS